MFKKVHIATAFLMACPPFWRAFSSSCRGGLFVPIFLSEKNNQKIEFILSEAEGQSLTQLGL
ncbi:MAG: hypothetical protein APF83_00335 [Lutibacter sp. BRH_c52]|nr:MAG: hypothetical protein APF83_00335 [Lutibacter sp. BRH_c52]